MSAPGPDVSPGSRRRAGSPDGLSGLRRQHRVPGHLGGVRRAGHVDPVGRPDLRRDLRRGADPRRPARRSGRARPGVPGRTRAHRLGARPLRARARVGVAARRARRAGAGGGPRDGERSGTRHALDRRPAARAGARPARAGGEPRHGAGAPRRRGVRGALRLARGVSRPASARGARPRARPGSSPAGRRARAGLRGRGRRGGPGGGACHRPPDARARERGESPGERGALRRLAPRALLPPRPARLLGGAGRPPLHGGAARLGVGIADRRASGRPGRRTLAGAAGAGRSGIGTLADGAPRRSRRPGGHRRGARHRRRRLRPVRRRQHALCHAGASPGAPGHRGEPRRAHADGGDRRGGDRDDRRLRVAPVRPRGPRPGSRCRSGVRRCLPRRGGDRGGGGPPESRPASLAGLGRRRPRRPARLDTLRAAGVYPVATASPSRTPSTCPDP